MKKTTILLLGALLGLAAPAKVHAQDGTDAAGKQDAQRDAEARGKKKARGEGTNAAGAKRDASGKVPAKERQGQAGAQDRQQGANGAQGTQAAKPGDAAQGAKPGGQVPKVQNLGDRAGVQQGAGRDAAGTQDRTGQEVRGERVPPGNQSNADRAKAAREQSNAKKAERIENARDQAQDKRADRVAAGREQAQTKEQKAKVVDDMTRRVREHRVRMAEIQRLESIFEKQGDAEKLARVAKIKEKEQESYTKIMERYENALGQKDFKAVRGRLKVDDNG